MYTPQLPKGYILIASLIGITVSAEPFLAPHDLFLRHEIRFLQDSGNLDSILNTWPLNLGGLKLENHRPIESYNLIDSEIRKESRVGWIPLKSRIGVSDKRITSHSFGNVPRGSFVTNLETSWMSNYFAANLSMSAFYGIENDWKGRKDEGLVLDGSYIAARLGNWSTSLGKVDRWWGPGWDGSLILSNNARPIPAISLDRRVPEPFESKWLSWIGPWSFNSFIGRMEKERTIPNPYLWGIRVDFKPTILDGLEVGLFRMMQLGGDGRPEGFKTWIDAFLSQDNVAANIDEEPGNQLAGLDIRWKPWDMPFALYGQVVGEDEDKFLPNSLMFQYGIEGWMNLNNGKLRVFVEYADLTSTWWTDDPRTNNITYGHHIYRDGYRYHGRTVGHWADADSQILSIGGLLLYNSGIGWGTTIRNGNLNEDGTGNNSVSNAMATDYFSVEVFNSRSYKELNLDVYTSLGWEDLDTSSFSDTGLTFNLSLTKLF